MSFMSENLNSNNLGNDKFHPSKQESDYKDLIKRLKDIKLTISLLEKTLFK